MRAIEPTGTLEPTVLGAAWRYRGLVVVATAMFGFLAWLFAIGVESERYTATASIIVEDPRASILFEAAPRQRTEDYVADQVEVMRSSEVARRAADLMNEKGVAPPVSTEDLLDSVDVDTKGEGTALINITVIAVTRDQAILGANSFIESYETLLRSQASATFASSITVLDESIDELNRQSTEVRARINEITGTTDPGEDALLGDLDALRARLTSLQTRLLAATTPEARTALRDEIDDITLILDAVNSVRALEATDAELAELLLRQTQLINRIDDLEARRDGIRLDGELLGTGVRISTTAEEAVRVSNTAQTTALGAIIGAVLGVIGAYSLALRRRRFDDRGEPALVLGSPLIAEVPSFRQEGVRSPVPVRTAPRSASAEAFRFAASALQSARVAGNNRVAPGGGGGTSIAITSAKVAEGKTVVAVNTALAVARTGKRVLLIDADFGNQLATQLLAPDARPERGFTEVVLEGLPLSESVVAVEGSSDGSGLHLLARGMRRSNAPEFFSLPETREFLHRVSESYDFVLLDTPPLLQVAYASAVVGLVDGALIVVPHGGHAADLQQLSGRLELLGTRAVGYIYNLAPLRADMTASEGSMADVLGHTS